MKVAMVINDKRPRGAQLVAKIIAHCSQNVEFDFYAKFPDYGILDINALPLSELDAQQYDLVHLHFCGTDYGLKCKNLFVTTHQRNSIYNGECLFHSIVFNHRSGVFVKNPLPYWEPIRPQIDIKQPFELTVGTRHYMKGPDIFIKMLQEYFMMYGPDRRQFVFVGYSKDDVSNIYENFEEDISSLKKQGMLINVVESIQPEYVSWLIQNANNVIHTSRDEAQSLTLLEAQSYGIPIIAADIIGNRETVRVGNFVHLNKFGPEIFTYKINSDALQSNAKYISQEHNPYKIAKIYERMYKIAYANA